MNINLQNQFYVVRHGKAQNNELGIISCKLETQKAHGLSQNGKEVVSQEAERYKDFDIIYASPFERTKETALIFAKASGCNVIKDKRLVEFDVGDLDTQPSQAFSSAMDAHKEVDFVFKIGIS